MLSTSAAARVPPPVFVFVFCLGFLSLPLSHVHPPPLISCLQSKVSGLAWARVRFPPWRSSRPGVSDVWPPWQSRDSPGYGSSFRRRLPYRTVSRLGAWLRLVVYGLVVLSWPAFRLVVVEYDLLMLVFGNWLILMESNQFCTIMDVEYAGLGGIMISLICFLIACVFLWNQDELVQPSCQVKPNYRIKLHSAELSHKLRPRQAEVYCHSIIQVSHTWEPGSRSNFYADTKAPSTRLMMKKCLTCSDRLLIQASRRDHTPARLRE